MHKTVLLQQAVDGLDIQVGDIFVDGTLGSGGHSELVAQRFGDAVQIIGLDMDVDALSRSEMRLKKLSSKMTFIQANFRNLDKVLDDMHIEHANKILLDIGLSSNQFEESGRGFSFQKDESLTMTFKKNLEDSDLTAEFIVNNWDEENLATIIYSYGEERFARKIAKKIVEVRSEKPIKTTTELVDIIVQATPGWYHHRKIHPATKTFQALRITVNDELQALKEGLEKGFKRLASHGRIAVISFHSLEDRIVKKYFRQKHDEGVAQVITKRPITPEESELEGNRRSRSAKLRILEKN
jgi:16S rRNA (cytosine1402-N4)-methyltransferase